MAKARDSQGLVDCTLKEKLAPKSQSSRDKGTEDTGQSSIGYFERWSNTMVKAMGSEAKLVYLNPGSVHH